MLACSDEYSFVLLDLGLPDRVGLFPSLFLFLVPFHVSE